MKNHDNHAGGLRWPPLTAGTLVKRYRRFLADVRLEDGRQVTAHCPNSGSMKTCSEPGRPVYLSSHFDNPKRKLPYTWELITMPTSLVGVNTLVPNRLLKKAISADQLPELAGYARVQSEVKYGRNSRIDLLLSDDDGGRPPCYVEIKNCTLVEDGVAMFPDAVTSRGLKHLRELESETAAGRRAVMLFLIQRMDARHFRPADHLDPAYGRELRRSRQLGVEILAYDVYLDLVGIRLNQPVPLDF